jgi:hypothetical protein
MCLPSESELFSIHHILGVNTQPAEIIQPRDSKFNPRHFKQHFLTAPAQRMQYADFDEASRLFLADKTAPDRIRIVSVLTAIHLAFMDESQES